MSESEVIFFFTFENFFDTDIDKTYISKQFFEFNYEFKYLTKMEIKVFELYSGLGGMHFALRESEIEAKVVCAIDINTTANTVYRKNFPEVNLLEKNIQSLTEQDFNQLDIEMILMSPPCQPHTRNGLKKDKSDRRSDSLLHIITLIPKLKTVKYILLENVKGFETSSVRNELVETLQQSDYVFQEFLLSPNQFSIPNSRLRYYLLAKKKPLQFCFERKQIIMKELPNLKPDVALAISKLNLKYKKLCTSNECFEIGLILDEETSHIVPENVLKKYGTLFDIVTKESVRSCCFTKGYGHFVEGTGSVLSQKNSNYISKVFDEIKECPKNTDKIIDLLNSLKLRYFSPKEISAIMGFPKSLTFPNYLSFKQKYRLLGNSINIHVVGLLVRILSS